MPLSKARMRALKRFQRAEAKGVLPDSNLAISILPPDERKQVLKEIALHAIDKPVTAGQKIAAIRELNLMEGSYAPIRHQHIVFEVRLVDRDTIETGDWGLDRGLQGKEGLQAEGLLEGGEEESTYIKEGG